MDAVDSWLNMEIKPEEIIRSLLDYFELQKSIFNLQNILMSLD